MYRRILVPIDGSDTAQRGLQEAIGLAKVHGANLVLLHVVEYYPVMMEMATATTWESVSRDLREHGQGVLDAAHAVATAAGVASESHLEDAAAARVCDVVVAQVGVHRCDLVVMGTHGRRGMQHALVGSDAERVIRLCAVPLLLVKAADAAT